MRSRSAAVIGAAARCCGASGGDGSVHGGAILCGAGSYHQFRANSSRSAVSSVMSSGQP